MGLLHTIAVGVLVLASVTAFVGMLYVMLLAGFKKSRPYTSYAIASAGLAFLSCLAGGLILFLDQPEILVLVVILVASFISAWVGYESLASSFRFENWLNSQLQKKRERRK